MVLGAGERVLLFPSCLSSPELASVGTPWEGNPASSSPVKGYAVKVIATRYHICHAGFTPSMVKQRLDPLGVEIQTANVKRGDVPSKIFRSVKDALRVVVDHLGMYISPCQYHVVQLRHSRRCIALVGTGYDIAGTSTLVQEQVHQLV